MNICISGSTGLVGRALVRTLQQRGEHVYPLHRAHATDARALYWDPDTYTLARPEELAKCAAVIHLGGTPIAGRWSAARKELIHASRTTSTHQLARQLAALASPPPVWLVASAIGFYGSRGETVLTEEATAGAGFLADVCREWEAAAAPARAAGIRVVHLRFGMLLDPAGGALKAMLPAFSCGLGGALGSGQQYMSWATLEDAIRAILFILDHHECTGPINITAPTPCTNHDFTKALGQALRRPTWARVPATLARWVFGEMADALLLASQRVLPAKLNQAGFTFDHPDIATAFAALIK